MESYVIDTSAIVWAFIEDEQTKKVQKLLELASEGSIDLLAPSLLWYEFYSVITKKYSSDEMALRIMEAFELLISEGTVQIIESEITSKAIQISHLKADGQEGHIGPSDAYFHALALDSGSIFLTNDKKHFNKTTKHIGSVMLFESLLLAV